MGDEIAIHEVSSIHDTDRLWTALVRAKHADDHAFVRAIENRMRDIGQHRRFEHLSDAELAARIRGLNGNRAPQEALSYSPADGQGLDGASDTAALNRAIRANQQAGVEVTLGRLMDEWKRRQTSRPA